MNDVMTLFVCIMTEMSETDFQHLAKELGVEVHELRHLVHQPPKAWQMLERRATEQGLMPRDLLKKEAVGVRSAIACDGAK